jgi:CVNH domain
MFRNFVFRSAVMATAITLIGLAAGSAQAAPAGSYQKTCSNITENGTTLNASCKTFSGQSMQTSLPYYASCVGDIGNINGTLACAGPNGSYALTCTNAIVEGNTLSATCKKKNGTPVKTSLPGFQGFQGNISNCDGVLRNGNC